uniref:Uncharacterized protein n=1 Tax=Sus scrofa TaxID=9823 RepID=A0A4X1SHC4_PIG
RGGGGVRIGMDWEFGASVKVLTGAIAISRLDSERDPFPRLFPWLLARFSCSQTSLTAMPPGSS